MCRYVYWLLEHFRDLPGFQGLSSVIAPLEQVSQQRWHTVTIATPVFLCPLLKFLVFTYGTFFIASIKLDRNVFISEKTEQALVPPTEPLAYKPFLC